MRKMYCEYCKRLVEGDRCSFCGKKCKRDVQADDLCPVRSIGQIWADMLCDVLQQNEIPYYKQSDIGAGMAMLTGLHMESFSIFVPYSRYEEAKETADALFSQVEEGEEGALEEDGDAVEKESEDE